MNHGGDLQWLACGNMMLSMCIGSLYVHWELIMFLIIFCLHRLCSSLNQPQDTSSNARFVQVSWSKLAVSCWPPWLNSLNPRAVLFHKLCTKAPENQSSPRVRVRGYTKGSGRILWWSIGFEIRKRTFHLAYQISIRCQIIPQIHRCVGPYIH